jgi:glycosyltransferase involved in cell wall biosynthesis
MNILIITSGHFWDDDRIAYKQGASLASLGHKVVICGRRRKPIQLPGVEFIDLALRPGIRAGGKNVVSFPSRLSRILILPRLWHYAKTLKPDLMVCHDFETAILAYLLKKRFRLPYVFDCHEFYQFTVTNIAPLWIRPVIKRVVLRILRMVATHAEAVTVVSSAMERFFDHIAPLTSCEILYNSPIIDYFPFVEDETTPITIVHEGSLSRNRGALEMTEALALVRKDHDFRFLILGEIPDDFHIAFKGHIAELGLDDVVDMPGRLPWKEFGEVEATGQIGLICMQPLPNNLNGLSNKLYSYMACGLAVVGMKDSETARMIDKYKCGVSVDSGNPEDIARGIRYLLDNPQIRREMARNGRRAIESELGWHCMERVMGKLYGDIEVKLKVGMTKQ